MGITLALNGLDKAINKIAAIKTNTHKAEYQALERVALLLRDTVVQYAGEGHPEHPEVQTGRLRSSIRYLVEDGTPVKAYVGSDAVYASFVEFGHAQEPGRFVPTL